MWEQHGKGQGQGQTQRLTVRQKMRAGERKWYGPRFGLVLCLFFLYCMYLTLFLTTARRDKRKAGTGISYCNVPNDLACWT